MGGPERVTRPEAGTDVHEATRGTLAARIRVYELARELGLTNKEALDLCIALGIGVKSHSSSIVEAHADRVRRKAEREGLIRDVQPEEPEADKKPAKKGTKKAAGATEPAEEVPVPSPVIELTTPEAPIQLDTAPPEVAPLAPAASFEPAPDLTEPRIEPPDAEA